MNKTIRNAVFSSGVASLTLEEGIKLPTVGDVIEAEGTEATVSFVDPETRKVKLLVTKLPEFHEQLDRYRDIAWDCMHLLAYKQSVRDGNTWNELSAEKQDDYLEEALSTLYLLQSHNLLRFSPFLIE